MKETKLIIVIHDMFADISFITDNTALAKEFLKKQKEHRRDYYIDIEALNEHKTRKKYTIEFNKDTREVIKIYKTADQDNKNGYYYHNGVGYYIFETISLEAAQIKADIELTEQIKDL